MSVVAWPRLRFIDHWGVITRFIESNMLYPIIEFQISIDWKKKLLENKQITKENWYRSRWTKWIFQRSVSQDEVSFTGENEVRCGAKKRMTQVLCNDCSKKTRELVLEGGRKDGVGAGGFDEEDSRKSQERLKSRVTSQVTFFFSLF